MINSSKVFFPYLGNRDSAWESPTHTPRRVLHTHKSSKTATRLPTTGHGLHQLGCPSLLSVFEARKCTTTVYSDIFVYSCFLHWHWRQDCPLLLLLLVAVLTRVHRHKVIVDWIPVFPSAWLTCFVQEASRANKCCHSGVTKERRSGGGVS